MDEPSCSNATKISSLQDDDLPDELQELKNIGVTVWGQQQEVLEQQALDELTTFNNNLNQNAKDGENCDQVEAKGEEISKPISKKLTNQAGNSSEQGSLDVTSYINRQVEFKKRQDYKRSLEVSDKSKLIANQINRKQYNKSLVSPSKNKVNALRTRERLKRKRKLVDQQETKEIATEPVVEIKKLKDDAESGSDYCPSEPDSDYEPGYNEKSTDVKLPVKKLKASCSSIKNGNTKYEKVIDDGNVKAYEERLNQYYEKLEAENKQAIDDGTELPETEVVISNGFKTSSKIWNSLYSYQREGVEWLWTIHQKVSGGLLGDEMGLGKTVEIIAFLYSLNYSRGISSYGGFKGLGPTLIVCPSTVIHQWVKHFYDWAPEFRVSVLHQSGTYTGSKHKLIKDNMKSNGILITTYQSMLKYKGLLINENWHYIILDEGHKIRNPGAKISEAVKLFKTPYRLLLTGSPMQNNLQELWSLFDFTNPGMLGTLQVFMEHFAMPIMQGGYSNATPMQEALALSMATALKNMITPHLLRRAKIDVKHDIHLPNKSEQVLFCSITPQQRDLYKGFLMSDHINNILGRGSKNWFAENHTRANVLMSITTLRKICNHPDIYLNEVDDEQETGENGEDTFGYYKRSGKMVVVAALLKMWKKQNHRVLLFTQSRAMIGIFERYLTVNEYKYLKMDGGTSIVSRQPLIDKFNDDKSIDVFLLTTRVGGLGVNLTGADRVIIYDPDWNPATDTQARERAWRIGQEKEVTIYRLLSAGTIEEKMYQRQIWKQLLSNKVLLDPKTQRFFKSSDLHDLFSLQEHVDSNPETTNIFQNSRISLEEKLKKKTKDKCATSDPKFTDDKIEKMKQLAAQISKNISQNSNKKERDKIIDPFQLDLKEERDEKLKQRRELKKLTPTELLHYNRDKLNQSNDDETNQLDDCETDVNFTKALVISEKAADLYKAAKGNSKKIDTVAEEYKSLTQVFAKSKKHKGKDEKCEVDVTGQIDGEVIEGLVKRKSKKVENNTNPVTEHQDNYVLNKLFSKKGVQSALQHDNVVQCAPSEATSIKVHSETQMRTDIALQALRKSRITKWKW